MLRYSSLLVSYVALLHAFLAHFRALPKTKLAALILSIVQTGKFERDCIATNGVYFRQKNTRESLLVTTMTQHLI